MISKIRFNAQQEVEKDGNKIKIPVPSNIALQTQGPVLQVTITHPQQVVEELAKEGKHPKAINCNALIDTGAFSCVISPKIAADLGLVQTGFAPVTSVNNTEDRPVYYGVIIFPWGMAKEIQLACCDIQGVDCLIGRDILQHWHMVYDGTSGEITICD